MLWSGTVCGEQSAADRDSVYDSREGRVYHGIVYRDGTGVRHFFKKACGDPRVGQRGACGGGAVSALHHRPACARKGRYSGAALCRCLCSAYFSGGSFFSENRWCADVLHSVSGVRAALWCVYAAHRAPGNAPDLAGMAADPLCGCFFLRRGLYPADYRTKGNRSDSGISDPEPGIGRLGAGGLAAARTALKCEGARRLRADVCGDFAGADAGAMAILS